MSNYKVTVIKTGNSYALRVPKQYIVDAQLKLGQKASIPLPSSDTRQDRAKIQAILRQINELQPYEGVTDPATWQREIRADRPLPGRNQT